MAENEMNVPADEAAETSATEATTAEASTTETGMTDVSAAEAMPASGEVNTTGDDEASAETQEAPASTEEITYHAVERDGQVAAIWEMQGRKHLRTIDPRSRMGQEILRLYTSEHHDESHTAETAEAAPAQ